MEVSAPVQAPSSGEREEERWKVTVTTEVMEWFRRNDDSMDVGNVMSSNICISLAISQTPCSLCRLWCCI